MEIKAEEHIGLVVHIANRFRKNAKERIYDSEEFADGMLGLAKAINKFNPSMGFKFTTFAWVCVYNSISNGINARSKIREVAFGEFYEHGREDAEFIEDDYIFRVQDQPTDDAKTKRCKYIVRECVLNSRTLKDMAGEMHLTQERIRQIKNDGLDKLKNGIW